MQHNHIQAKKWAANGIKYCLQIFNARTLTSLEHVLKIRTSIDMAVLDVCFYVLWDLIP
jgi:hypothetical protein